MVVSTVKRTGRQEAQIVVGIDPGLANLGLGAVCEEGRQARYLGSTLVRTSSKEDQAERLHYLYESVRGFLIQHGPDAVAIEGQYFHHQREMSFKLGQAYGICLLAARTLDLEVFEYGPMQVKQALVGAGRASKAQVSFMVRALLTEAPIIKDLHVTDALALALTHLSSRRISQF
jgi:crossover junction endodeoxyribonuclease RuvC